MSPVRTDTRPTLQDDASRMCTYAAGRGAITIGAMNRIAVNPPQIKNVPYTRDPTNTSISNIAKTKYQVINKLASIQQARFCDKRLPPTPLRAFAPSNSAGLPDILHPQLTKEVRYG